MRRGPMSLAAGILAIYVVIVVVCLADNGAYYNAGSYHKHSNPTTGVNRDATKPRGSCNQCHIQHTSGTTYDFELFAANDNNLCGNASCHSGTYQQAWDGLAAYDTSGHGASTALYLPGTGRQTKLCVQCHNPHGNRDATNGLYPSLLDYLEEGGAAGGYTAGGCYSNNATAGAGCHGNVVGNRPTGAVDVYSQFLKANKHNLAATTKAHVSNETQTAGWNPSTNRHVECVDCHNPHRAKPGSHAPPTNTLSNMLLGTWGVEPTFGGAWVQPTVFTVKQFTNDPPLASDKEYQLCLKCHSYFSWTTSAPAGYTDQATEFNPANPSYHMVAASTRSTGMFASAAMVTSPYVWTTSSTMFCSDCHSEETTTSTLSTVKGAHGAGNARILWGVWNGTTGATGTNTHLCFKCHAWNSYGRGGTGARTTTGFADSSRNLHTFHMGKGTTCWNCHVKVTHGWRRAHLIAQRADQATYPLYFGSAGGSFPGIWINITTWRASGTWLESNCDHTGC